MPALYGNHGWLPPRSLAVTVPAGAWGFVAGGATKISLLTELEWTRCQAGGQPDDFAEDCLVALDCGGLSGGLFFFRILCGPLIVVALPCITSEPLENNPFFAAGALVQCAATRLRPVHTCQRWLH